MQLLWSENKNFYTQSLVLFIGEYNVLIVKKARFICFIYEIAIRVTHKNEVYPSQEDSYHKQLTAKKIIYHSELTKSQIWDAFKYLILGCWDCRYEKRHNNESDNNNIIDSAFCSITANCKYDRPPKIFPIAADIQETRKQWWNKDPSWQFKNYYTFVTWLWWAITKPFNSTSINMDIAVLMNTLWGQRSPLNNTY